MKKVLISMSILLSTYSFAQVGINTEFPKATLDIDSSQSSIVPDGLLIPRLSKIRARNMINTQASTLIYINDLNDNEFTNSGSTINVKSIGFYYFNGNQWVKLISGNDDSNIYNTDGQLTGDRTVDQNSNTLAFTAGTNPKTDQFSIDGDTFSVDALNDKIGIGTTSPESKLHIVGDLQFTGALKVGSTGDPGNNDQVLVSNGANIPPEWADMATDGINTFTFNNGLEEPTPNNIRLGGDLIQATELDINSKSLTFSDQVNSNGKFIIAKDGASSTTPIFYGNLSNNRVGIGTNNPQHKLHISGDMYLGKALYAGSVNDAGEAGQVLMSRGSGNSPIWTSITVGNTAPTYIFNNGLREPVSATNTIQLGGDLVENTDILTKNNAKLSITGSSVDAFSLKSTDGTNVFSADLNGKKIGIGTNTPTNSLDINGSLRIRDVPESKTSNNQILTITSDGVIQKTNSNEATYFLGGTVYVIKNDSGDGNTVSNNGGLNNNLVASTLNVDGQTFTGQKGGIDSIKGQGYKVSNPLNGIFVIEFNTSFTTIYGVSLNLIDPYRSGSNTPDPDYAGSNLSVTDGTQIAYISNKNIIVKTGNNNKRNRSFSFLVIGK